MSIEIIDILKPKNGLSFKLIEDIDIAVTGYTSLADAVSHFATKEGMISAINTALSGKQGTLSPAQLAACNSGITAQLVTQIGTNTTDLNALSAEIDDKADAADLTKATASLQAQIDAIVTPVTQDAEVQNARVDAEGISHTTLKSRIDSTENKFTAEINHIVDKTYSDAEYDNTSTYEQSYDGYFDSSGFNESNTFISYSMRISKNTTIYCDSVNEAYFSICVYNTASLTSGTRYRLVQGGEDTLPYENSAVSLTAGQYVVFTTRKDSTAFTVVLTDYSASYSLDSTLSLSNAHIQQVISAAGIDDIESDITELKKTVVDTSEYVNLDIQSDILSFEESAYSGQSGWVESQQYDSWYFTADSDTKIYMSDIGSGGYMQLCIYPNGAFGDSNYQRYRNTDNNLPTSESPLSITAGTLITIGTNKSNNTWQYRLQVNKKKLAPDISLSSTQVQQVQKAVSAGYDIKYAAGVLTIEGNGVECSFSDINFNSQHGVFELQDFTYNDALIFGSSNDYLGPVRINGESIKGAKHGDEVTDNVTIVADGTAVTNGTEITGAKSITIYVESTIATDEFKRYTVWTLNADSLVVSSILYTLKNLSIDYVFGTGIISCQDNVNIAWLNKEKLTSEVLTGLNEITTIVTTGGTLVSKRLNVNSAYGDQRVAFSVYENRKKLYYYNCYGSNIAVPSGAVFASGSELKLM